ncbi:MAG: PIN domain-containing protein [Chloroflexi bacterium]|nr:PIN domain-containing protein [Chloroflexota bacterium]
MPSQRQRIYWDANVWLSYINGEASRLPVLDALLADSSSPKGNIEIYTSEMSEVEVAFAKFEQDNKALDPDIEKQIDELWTDRDTLKTVEYHHAIGIEARAIIRLGIDKGWQLKPLDAIHLATARRLQVAEFHTYDKRLLKYSNDVGFVITEPYVIQPRFIS